MHQANQPKKNQPIWSKSRLHEMKLKHFAKFQEELEPEKKRWFFACCFQIPVQIACVVIVVVVVVLLLTTIFLVVPGRCFEFSII
jgi:hypothetical protein